MPNRILLSVLVSLYFPLGCSDPSQEASDLAKDASLPGDTVGEEEVVPSGLDTGMNPPADSRSTAQDGLSEDTLTQDMAEEPDSLEEDSAEPTDTGSPAEDSGPLLSLDATEDVQEESGDTGGNADASVPLEPDTSVPDAAAAPSEEIWLDACPSELFFNSPGDVVFHPINTPVIFSVTLAEPVPVVADSWSVRWENQDGDIYGETSIIVAGAKASTELPLAFAEAQSFDMHARLITPEGSCPSTTSLAGLHYCTFLEQEDFAAGLANGWLAMNAAFWVDGGADGTWMELTGNVSGQRGALYNENVTVTAGSASIAMTFATGGGINSGADGLAMTVVDVETIGEAVEVIEAASPGGGLGYAVSGAYGDWEGDSLHVEVDTWNNVENGSELHTDPTPQNHVAISLNGDPANLAAWQAIPSIEDLNWHTVRVDIDGSHIRVFFDGELATEQTVDGLDFRGGYIYFSASTGWATNFHRVSNLNVIHGCK